MFILIVLQENLSCFLAWVALHQLLQEMEQVVLLAVVCLLKNHPCVVFVLQNRGNFIVHNHWFVAFIKFFNRFLDLLLEIKKRPHAVLDLLVELLSC